MAKKKNQENKPNSKAPEPQTLQEENPEVKTPTAEESPKPETPEEGKGETPKPETPEEGKGETPKPETPEEGKEETPKHETPEEGKIALKVRSTTGGPYRRLGRVFQKEAVSLKVTAEEQAVLEKDPWLEVTKVEG